MTPGVAQFNAASSDGEFFNAAPQTITISSDGTADVQKLSLRNTVPNGPFSYLPRCPTYLGRGQQCTVRVSFAPRDTRPQADSLSAYDGGVQLATVTVRGSSTIPQPPPGHPHVTFKPREVQFPVSPSDGWVTLTQNVGIVSDGTADVQRLVLRITPQGAPFAIPGGCPPRLPQRQGCTLQVTFDQKSQRAYDGTLTAYDGNSVLATLPLHGGGGNVPTGGHPHVTMTPSALKFGGSTQLQYSAMYVPPARTIEIRNDGPVDLRALSLRLSPPGAPFRNSTCPSGLARGQSCSVRVDFSAKDGRQYAATLSAFEGGTAMASAQLYGMGVNRPQPPPGKGTGTINKANPNGSVVPANGATGGPAAGNPQGTQDGPKAGSTSKNAGGRSVGPNRVAIGQQVPRVTPAPPATKTPAKRPVQKPPPPPVR
jgi:hypothetical protein